MSQSLTIAPGEPGAVGSKRQRAKADQLKVTAMEGTGDKEAPKPAAPEDVGDKAATDQDKEENGLAPEAEGEVKLRKNSIQERRKGKGLLPGAQVLRLPVQRSASSPRLTLERGELTALDSPVRERAPSPTASSSPSHGGPRSPAMMMLSRVFSFHNSRSPSKSSPSPPYSPVSSSSHSSQKDSPKHRRSLHFPVPHSPSPTSGKSRFPKFSAEVSSAKSSSTKSSPTTTSPPPHSSRSEPVTPKKVSPLNPKARSKFFLPSPPVSPVYGTVERMGDTGGILYRPSSTRRNLLHRRTLSDSLGFHQDTVNYKQLEKTRKRSRDDMECEMMMAMTSHQLR
ncbi:proline-rich receptor-like protein kinase PERK12 [Penaeus japonicus]|uniref:proline-rich receptor-like protein kinase PERK12 n=1 Tax=Penaeus japonicus TaxID=27405 RepID=UPI001C717783|nr:proline-rich receptor-like protein kinase PERK12 [Penaeus japonicus]